MARSRWMAPVVLACLLAVGVLAACGDDDEPPRPNIPATSTALPLPNVVDGPPFTYINAVTYGRVTLTVTEGMPERVRCPESVYEEDLPTYLVSCYPLDGMVLNTAIPGAEAKLNDAFDYALLLAWSAQAAVPAGQQDLAIAPGDDDATRLAKLDAVQARLAAGEAFTITMLANLGQSTTVEEVTFDWDAGWTYAIDMVESPTPFVTWQRDLRSGVRILPGERQFRVELYARNAGYQGTLYEDIYLSTLVLDILRYLPELTRETKLPDLLEPHGRTQLALVDGFYDIAGKFFIPGATPGTQAADWADSILHPLP